MVQKIVWWQTIVTTCTFVYLKMVFGLLLVKNAQNNWEKISDVELLYLNLVLFHLNQSFYKNGYVC